MDVKNFIQLIVFGVIGVIVIGAFTPIIAETTSATDTFENDGYFHMTKYSADTTIIVDWDYENPTIVTINDTNYDFTGYGMSLTFVFAENVGIRIYWNLSGVQVIMPLGTMGVDVNEQETLHAEFVNGTLTATMTRVGADDVNVTVAYNTPIYCISNTGDYVMKKSNESAYMSGDSEFIGLGVTTVTGVGAKTILVKGTIDDGATATIVTTAGTPATLSDVTIDNVSVDNYVSLYKLNKLTFTGNAEGSADTPITYSYFVVPYEVTAEKSVHPDTALSSVIDLLPLVAGMGLFIILVGAFLYRRYI